MKINMTDKYALADNPTEQIRIICVDGEGNTPVAFQNIGSSPVYLRHSNGASSLYPDIVPLKVPLVEAWVKVFSDGSMCVYPIETKVSKYRGGNVIHMREVRDD